MASKSGNKITIVGFKQAKKGFTFLHSTALEECKTCELLKTCMESLEPGRIYSVAKVRNKVFPCKIHEEGVRVVEVEESSLEAALEPRVSFKLATITFRPQGCRNLRCLNSRVCAPPGLVDGDKCKILEVKEKIVCPLSRSLVRALVEREPLQASDSRRPQ